MVKRENIIRFLIIVNIILCVYLIYDQSQNKNFCVIGSTCDLVWSSMYSNFLGIPLSWFGAAAFVIFGLFSFLRSKSIWIERFYVLAAGGAGVMALYLIIVQAFVLKSFCSTCMVIDCLSIIIAVLASEDMKNLRSMNIKD